MAQQYDGFDLGLYSLEKTEFVNVFRFYRIDGQPIGLEKKDIAGIVFCLAYREVMVGFCNEFIFTAHEDGDGGLKLIVTTSAGTYPDFLTNSASA